MKQSSLFDLMRVWAAGTGLALAAWYFGALYLDISPAPLVSLLIAGIGGFEMFLCVQDFVLKRSR